MVMCVTHLQLEMFQVELIYLFCRVLALDRSSKNLLNFMIIHDSFSKETFLIGANNLGGGCIPVCPLPVRHGRIWHITKPPLSLVHHTCPGEIVRDSLVVAKKHCLVRMALEMSGPQLGNYHQPMGTKL